MIGKGKAIAHTTVAMEYGWNQDKDAAVVLKRHVVGENLCRYFYWQTSEFTG